MKLKKNTAKIYLFDNLFQFMYKLAFLHITCIILKKLKYSNYNFTNIPLITLGVYF